MMKQFMGQLSMKQAHHRWATMIEESGELSESAEEGNIVIKTSENKKRPTS